MDFRVGQVHRVSKPMLMSSYSDSLNGSAIIMKVVKNILWTTFLLIYCIMFLARMFFNTIVHLSIFLCMFLFALLDKFAVRVLIKKCSPLTYIIFWLFSCACFNWHRAYRSFDGLVLLVRQQQQQQYRCFLESILIVVAELSLMSNSISLYIKQFCVNK